MVKMISCYLCDEEGELLKLTEKQLKDIPSGLLKDIFEAIQSAITGEKKSN